MYDRSSGDLSKKQKLATSSISASQPHFFNRDHVDAEYHDERASRSHSSRVSRRQNDQIYNTTCCRQTCFAAQFIEHSRSISRRGRLKSGSRSAPRSVSRDVHILFAAFSLFLSSVTLVSLSLRLRSSLS